MLYAYKILADILAIEIFLLPDISIGMGPKNPTSVDVFLLCSRIGEHTPEEIDFGSQRLIANQNRTLLHHPAFDLRSHLQRREDTDSHHQIYNLYDPVALAYY